MIVILKNGAAEEKKNQLIDWLKEQGLQIHTSVGEYQTVLGLVGDTSRVDMDLIASLGIVDSVKRVTEPFKCCNRKFHPDDTVVQVGDVRIGGGAGMLKAQNSGRRACGGPETRFLRKEKSIMLVSLKAVLDMADARGAAVGSFNITSFECIQAVLGAAEERAARWEWSKRG